MRAPGGALGVDPGGHVDVVARREDLDDLVVLYVGDGGGVVGAGVVGGLDEGGLVQADRARHAEALAVRLEQGLSVGQDGVVDGVPVTAQLVGHVRHRAPVAHLARRPRGRPRGQQAGLRGDAVARGPTSPWRTRG